MTIREQGFALSFDRADLPDQVTPESCDDPHYAATLNAVFAATVAASPGAVALDDGRRRLTYQQLESEASRFARGLTRKGIGRGDRVGIQIPSGTVDLYIAILGVLLAGAAYVPVDFEDPAARSTVIWSEADVCAIAREHLNIEHRHAGMGRTTSPEPDDDCWVIFTSGTTGLPKAVAVTHHAAAAFVHAETQLWDVRSDDRVLAGLSVSFDASCEEIWLAWQNGAALITCPRNVVKSGVDLGPWMVERGITVISTVPTLAAMWTHEVLSNVRLLILGGEACPTELGWRLSESCEVWNTYGPTEATVVSTAARIVPGRPIRIGWPIDGWRVAIIDEEKRHVRFGEVGELVISGIGLGRYLDLKLDTEHFGAMPELGWARAYRTGDRVRMTSTGLEFVGRADTQVKIGGRRIELGEIEAQLTSIPGVQAAVTVVQCSASGNPMLVGYVAGDVDPSDLQWQLRQVLPEGIVPLVIRLDELPVKASGKVDRALLPWPPPAGSLRAREATDHATSRLRLNETETWVAEQWVQQLGPREILQTSNFFDLGGTSIAAAKLVSALRSRFPSAAVADIYTYRTLSELADHLEHLTGTTTVEQPPAVTHHRWGALQLVGLGMLIALGAIQWLIGLLAYNQLFGAGIRVGWLTIAAIWLIFSSAAGRTLIVSAARRIMLPRLRPGRYRRQGWLSMRIWFVERLSDALHLDLLAGTPWTTRYARMNGVKVGEGVRLATLPSPTGLLSIGARATLEGDVDARSWWIDGHELVVGEIHVGEDARVGTRCVLMPGSDIGAGAEIEPGSVIIGTVPAGERWSGSPARRVGVAGETWNETTLTESTNHAPTRVLYSFGLLALSLLPFIAAVPEVALLHAFGSLSNAHKLVRTVLIDAPLFSALYISSYALLVALAVRSVTWLIRPGTYSDKGAIAFALWFSEATLARARGVLFPLYSSVYTRSWLRLLGIQVGKRTEVSTAVGLNRLMSLGDTSFVADDVEFAGNRARGGRIEVTPIHVGSRTFLGNGAILGPATRMGDDSLVGILSSPPQCSENGTSWLGLPPLELPRIADCPDPSRTTNPPRRLVMARGAIEILRILVPATISIVLGATMFLTLEWVGRNYGGIWLVASAPVIEGVASAVAVAITIIAKWLLIGRYHAGEHPLWSSFVWRDELVNTFQEQLAGAWLLERAFATPVLPLYLRAMGARIGKGVWIECLNVTEFDLVQIDEGCSVNRGACIDTHLVHDRVMRMGPAVMCSDSTLGPESAVLPDTKLGAGCTVGARSVVLRGEELPPHTNWHGLPVQSR